MKNGNGVTGRAAEKELATAQLTELVYQARTHTVAVAKLASQIVNDLLICELVTFDATGVIARQFEVPVGSVAIANHGANPVTVTAGGAVADTPPAKGVAMGRVRASTAAVLNLTGRQITLWGTAGDTVTFQAWTKPQAPAWGPA